MRRWREHSAATCVVGLASRASPYLPPMPWVESIVAARTQGERREKDVRERALFARDQDEPVHVEVLNLLLRVRGYDRAHGAGRILQGRAHRRRARRQAPARRRRRRVSSREQLLGARNLPAQIRPHNLRTERTRLAEGRWNLRPRSHAADVPSSPAGGRCAWHDLRCRVSSLRQ